VTVAVEETWVIVEVNVEVDVELAVVSVVRVIVEV
jgi:hypothetical protein